MKRIAVLLAVAVALTVFCGCNRQEEESPASESGLMNITLTDIVQMKSTVPSDGAYVTLLGYNALNDGGGGTFMYVADSVLPDDGGTVIAPDGVQTGRYIRICEKNRLNVRMFGAKGIGTNDDTAAILNAVGALASGGTLVFPGGTYIITSTIVLKNGGITLQAQGDAQIIANGSMDAMISADGVSDIVIDSLSVICNGKASVGIAFKDAARCSVTNVSVTQFASSGLSLTGAKNCSFTNVSCYSVTAGAKALSVSGKSEYDLFNSCSFDAGSGADSAAGYFTDASELTFQSCSFKVKNDSSAGVVFDASAADGYPFALGFYSCDITDTKVLEGGSSIGRSYFYAYKTGDGQKIPEHDSLFGLTDDGRSFGIDALEG